MFFAVIENNEVLAYGMGKPLPFAVRITEAEFNALESGTLTAEQIAEIGARPHVA